MKAAGALNAIHELGAMRTELSRLLCRTGDLERGAGRFEAAMDCYRNAAILGQNPPATTAPLPSRPVSRIGNPDLLTGLGEQALSAGDNALAADYFLRALSIREQSPLTYRGLAIVHTRDGRLGAARAATARAEKLEAPRVTTSLEAGFGTAIQVRSTAVMLSRCRTHVATDLATDELPTAMLRTDAERFRTTRLEVPPSVRAAARSSAA